MSRHLRLLAFALLLPLAAQAAPLPDSVREQLVGRLGFDGTRLRELGNGEMRWFGLSIYQASLWSASVQFDDSVPFALSLRYSRDIPGKRLVSTSIDELKRLGLRDEVTLKRWEKLLATVFPDVREGESIVGVSLPAQGALFFHQGRLTGEISDPEFARAFFSIWLDSRTRAPELRERLLGMRRGS
ncbi:MAG TPA: chalcone isomerase family protein [Rhodocyclaceae bacterium]|nr:chalcone isomerase family protein [Rhodocyclaceae bacterium]HNH98490.1 chalcone isomerase family protein [Rhodocyclaceae bacterium]